jgi:hydroxypyruvate isomerase
VVADGTPAEEWKWLVEGVKEVYAHAEKAGIRIAIEPLNRFETYLINRGDQALALADAVGPNCGVCLDLFHVNIEESDIHEAFRKCKGRIYDVHIADNNRFAPGMGTLDFPAIVEDDQVNRLHGGTDPGVRGDDRPHACEPVRGAGRDQSGRRVTRAAEVHHRPRLQSAVG